MRCEPLMQDLYVMRRAVVIYERLIRRFTAQTTDYQVLLSTFAGGLTFALLIWALFCHDRVLFRVLAEP